MAKNSRTEKDIQQSLDEVSKSRTTLVIAHRLSTVIDADEILVLSDGLVVERGTHNALLALDGLYKQMWDRQSKGFADSVESHAGNGAEDADIVTLPHQQPAG